MKKKGNLHEDAKCRGDNIRDQAPPLYLTKQSISSRWAHILHGQSPVVFYMFEWATSDKVQTWFSGNFRSSYEKTAKELKQSFIVLVTSISVDLLDFKRECGHECVSMWQLWSRTRARDEAQGDWLRSGCTFLEGAVEVMVQQSQLGLFELSRLNVTKPCAASQNKAFASKFKSKLVKRRSYWNPFQKGH